MAQSVPDRKPDWCVDIATLSRLAEQADDALEWPAQSWAALCSEAVVRWPVPRALGGLEFSSADLLRGYERLSGACLTTTFILSQRDAAIRRLRDGARQDLAAELLPALAGGTAFATVGLSQLTTSRQHTAPALRATLSDQHIVLDGVIPWVSGADRADFLVAGATLGDGQQVLFVLPMELPGIAIGKPLPLAALRGSRTAEIACRSVAVPRRWLLAGPAVQVLSTGRGGAGGLETSCLAIGHAGGAIDDLRRDADSRPDLLPMVERLNTTRQSLMDDLLSLAEKPAGPDAAIALRARANALALRATQAALTSAKGAGFVHPHAAQRRARQAQFFLVWSCPRAAAEATLGYLGEGPVCS